MINYFRSIKAEKKLSYITAFDLLTRWLLKETSEDSKEFLKYYKCKVRPYIYTCTSILEQNLLFNNHFKTYLQQNPFIFFFTNFIILTD